MSIPTSNSPTPSTEPKHTSLVAIGLALIAMGAVPTLFGNSVRSWVAAVVLAFMVHQIIVVGGSMLRQWMVDNGFVRTEER